MNFFEKGKTNMSRGYSTFVQNPTQSELKRGIYRPRLTETHRYNCSGRSGKTLTIELSLPKLMYGNNFDELKDEDFPVVFEKLRQVLKDVSVRVYEKSLENAPVSAAHYSKNIPLTDGLTPHFLISKIKEANIKLSLDISETSYSNDGHIYKWHSNSYEVTFYDKIHDLGKAKVSDKRAIERDNAIQLGLFDNFKNRKMFEVLRMEIRLKRPKMRKLFSELGIEKEFTFKKLFSSQISQKVLLHYLNEIEQQRLPLLDYSTSDKALLADLVINNPSLGIKRTLQLYGFKQALNNVSIRELRTMFGKCSSNSWYRLMSDANKVKPLPHPSPFKVIRDNLERFEPLNIVDFQDDKMLNNDKYN
ncbi:MAG TPA: hypothetical protein VF185_01945 [Patescibacteria group bacterium]